MLNEGRHGLAVQLALSNDRANARREQRRQIPRHPFRRRRTGRPDDLTRLGWGRSNGIEDLSLQLHGQHIATLERLRQARGTRIAKRDHGAGQLHRVSRAELVHVIVEPAVAIVDCDDVTHHHHSSIVARRVEWQPRFTATGSPAMWVGYTSMLTARAVTTPPRPWGPMPSALTRSSNCPSRSRRSARGWRTVSGRRTAFLASSAAVSNVPPTPTPTMTGGQAFAPARSTVSRTKSVMPAVPSAGTNIRNALMFSAPNPFDATVSHTRSPGTSST